MFLIFKAGYTMGGEDENRDENDMSVNSLVTGITARYAPYKARLYRKWREPRIPKQAEKSRQVATKMAG